MPDNDLTVFVVDDDAAIRASVSRALRRRGYEVETYDCARNFLAAYEAGRPGCLILDQGMPGMTGLELQEHLHQTGHALPIIFITGHGGVPESVQAIKRGAVDFLEKPFRQAVLVERIEAAFEMSRQRVRSDRRNRDLRQRFQRLTAREQQVVQLMLADPSAVSSKEIGRRLEISPRTVDHHRARILEKLQLSSVIELIDLARRADLEQI